MKSSRTTSTKLIYLVRNNRIYSLFLWGQDIKRGAYRVQPDKRGKKNFKEF